MKKEEILDLTKKAEVLETDHDQPVVWRHGDLIIKRFVRKPGLSSDWLWPYSLRFARNARRLIGLGVNAPRIVARQREGACGPDLLVYERVPGRPAAALGAALEPDRIAGVYARLHERGVLFRALHLSNILLDDDGGFGIIDITDVRFVRPPLAPAIRARNLGYIWAHPRDAAYFTPERLEQVITAYIDQAALPVGQAQLFRTAVEKYLVAGRKKRQARRDRNARRERR